MAPCAVAAAAVTTSIPPGVVCWCSYRPRLSCENKSKASPPLQGKKRRNKNKSTTAEERKQLWLRGALWVVIEEQRKGAQLRTRQRLGTRVTRGRRSPQQVPPGGGGARRLCPLRSSGRGGGRGRTMEQVEWERAPGRRNTGAGSPGGAALRGRRALRSGPGRLRVCPELCAGGRAGPGGGAVRLNRRANGSGRTSGAEPRARGPERAERGGPARSGTAAGAPRAARVQVGFARELLVAGSCGQPARRGGPRRDRPRREPSRWGHGGRLRCGGCTGARRGTRAERHGALGLRAGTNGPSRGRARVVRSLAVPGASGPAERKVPSERSVLELLGKSRPRPTERCALGPFV